MLRQKVLWPQLNVTITYGTSHSPPALLPAEILSTTDNGQLLGNVFLHFETWSLSQSCRTTFTHMHC